VEASELEVSKVVDLSYEEAVARIRATLQEQGFGVLTEIDVRAVLKEKLAVDFRKYVILGACNPTFAHKAFSTDLRVGLLLPCNVIVYEDDNGQTVVSALNPEAALEIVGNDALRTVAAEVAARMRQAVESV